MQFTFHLAYRTLFTFYFVFQQNNYNNNTVISISLYLMRFLHHFFTREVIEDNINQNHPLFLKSRAAGPLSI